MSLSIKKLFVWVRFSLSLFKRGSLFEYSKDLNLSICIAVLENDFLELELFEKQIVQNFYKSNPNVELFRILENDFHYQDRKTLSYKDFNLFGSIKNMDKYFFSKNFDFLITLSKKKSFLFSFFTKKCRAKFKIGSSTESSATFLDVLIIDHYNNQEKVFSSIIDVMKRI